VLELDYLERAPARFGYYVRRPRVVNIGHFLDDLREKGHEFTQEEWTQLSMIDVKGGCPILQPARRLDFPVFGRV